MDYLKTNYVVRDSRNGKVYVALRPVTTEYQFPQRKVLFCAARDANPFFHLYEALWMLGGRDDVASVARYVKRMKEFSDDGQHLQGAYGYRWRHWFGNDQLAIIVDRLRADYDDRRCVLSMWDGWHDLGHVSKDLPCNTHAYFLVNADGALDMTVCCRSNDIIWGAYGANLVHMSFLLEYMAAAVDVPIGRYFQVSNNFHAYAEVFDPLYEKMRGWWPQSPLDYPKMVPLVDQLIVFQEELHEFLDTDSQDFDEPFLRDVAVPMREAHRAWKGGSQFQDHIVYWLDKIAADDWRMAAKQWIIRRMR
jgi:thymidylate synthase